MENDLTNKLERLETFEERLGVRLDALFAFKGWTSGPFGNGDEGVWVTGELHPRDGVHLKQDLQVVLDVVDGDGRVVAISELCFQKDKFYGFESFRISALVAHGCISKIRLYPKQW